MEGEREGGEGRWRGREMGGTKTLTEQTHP